MGNSVSFGPFRFDFESGELHHGASRVLLQQKVSRALSLLVQRPGELVSREVLCWAIWPDGEVVDFEHGLNTTIKRLRTVLQDSAVSPMFIETVPQRGYRFVAKVASPRSPTDSHIAFIGRDRELETLNFAFQSAALGSTRCVFVTGEAGIGKSTLIQHFVNALEPATYLAEGQSVASDGPDDPFGPVLEAIRRLGVAHAEIAATIAQHAPTWMPHLPSFRRRGTPAPSIATFSSATRPRMLREAVAALETVAAERPLVIMLEDLQWADESSLALIHKLAEVRHSCLLTLCTFRPATGSHVDVLKEDLRLKRRAVELPLSGLSVDAVREFLQLRLPRLSQLTAVAEALHARTDGNPLFVIACMDALVQQPGIIGIKGGI